MNILAPLPLTHLSSSVSSILGLTSKSEGLADEELLASKMLVEDSEGSMQTLVSLGDDGLIGLASKQDWDEVKLGNNVGGIGVVSKLDLDPVLNQTNGLGISWEQGVLLVVGSDQVPDDGARLEEVVVTIVQGWDLPEWVVLLQVLCKAQEQEEKA